jgi:hypothetical protein
LSPFFRLCRVLVVFSSGFLGEKGGIETMDTRKPVLCIALLASLFAAAAHAASGAGSGAGSGPVSGAGGLTSGDLNLAFSADPGSELPIDTSILANGHCWPPDSLSGGIAKCRLIVGGVLNTTIAAPSPSSTSLSWQAVAADHTAEPVVTACGTFDTSLRIAGTAAQTASSLLLTPDPQAPDHGTFASSLEMNAVVHLTNRTTGETFDHPLVLGFGLTGPWALAAAPLPGKSNLVLLSDGVDHCTQVWVSTDDPFLKVAVVQSCEICLHQDAPVILPSRPQI